MLKVCCLGILGRQPKMARIEDPSDHGMLIEPLEVGDFVYCFESQVRSPNTFKQALLLEVLDIKEDGTCSLRRQGSDNSYLARVAVAHRSRLTKCHALARTGESRNRVSVPEHIQEMVFYDVETTIPARKGGR